MEDDLPKRNSVPESNTDRDQELNEQSGGELDREAASEELIRILQFEKEQLQDQLLRAMADLQNFRKRAQQEKIQTQQFATEALVMDLLPILDNFERTLAALEQGASMDALKEGVVMVDRQLRSVLESRQVKRIEARGKEFDPEMHEAIGSESAPGLPEGSVASEVEAGYKMGEKIIRPARVRVAKNS
jgi:molecular chaperone GrpE